MTSRLDTANPTLQLYNVQYYASVSNPSREGRSTMQILTFSEARTSLKQTMDDVCRDHEPAVITRQRGEPVVVMSLEDYNSMAETVYLLGNGKNASRLRESIAQHKAGKALAKEISLNVPTEN